MTLAKRLDAAEHNLSPKELVLLWMREAHSYHSYLSYWDHLRGQPDEAYPLFRLPRQNGEATRSRLKGRPEPQINKAICESEKNLLFLFHLHSQVNERLLQDTEALRLRIALLWALLHELLVQVQISDHYLFLSRRLEERWAYPLDEGTAHAVAAAERYAVETWKVVKEGAITQSWLDAQLRREGKTELPWAACLARGDTAPSPLLPIPSLEEIRPSFKDEDSYRAFLAATDYNYGFSDVTDREYEERAEALDAALRDLVRERPGGEGHRPSSGQRPPRVLEGRAPP